MVGGEANNGWAKVDDVMLDNNEMFMPHAPHCGYKLVEALDT